MWRKSFEEDWERRKQYLIRSLFEDLPPLSPVPEEDESFDSPRRATLPPHPHIPPKSNSRPHSPLPPLIIEREPNRHDEPEEYYTKLEKKIMKVYRKLFIEGKSDISSEISDAESNITKEINDVDDLEEQNGSVIDDLCNTATCVEMAETRNSHSAEEQNSTSTEDDNDFYFNKLSVEIDDNNDNTNDSSQDVDEELNETNDKNRTSETDPDDSFDSSESVNENNKSQNSNEIAIEKKGRKRTILEQDSEASKSKKSKSVDLSTTEFLSGGKDDSISHSRDEENVFRDHRIVEVVADIHIQAEEVVRAVESDAGEVDEDVDDDMVVLENNQVPDNTSSSSGKRSWSSVSEESISYEDAGTQTHFDSQQVNRNILRDVFVGPPKVYRLCSCVNHICVC